MVSRVQDWTLEYKRSLYSISLDVGEYDRMTVQIVAPIANPVSVYGTLDSGALQGVRDGNASLATNFTPIQVTNLATGTAGNTMATEGIYAFDVKEKFVRLSGGGANVYKLLTFGTKPY